MFNRAAWQGVLFETPADFEAFERILAEAVQRYAVPLFGYVVMDTHFHAVVRSVAEGDMSACMHWMETTHAQRWHAARGTTGRGAVYQGRFKAIPVQDDGHFLRLSRYVARNPVRRGLVERAEDWRWSSAWRPRADWQPVLAEWPVPKPEGWSELLSRPDTPRELALIRTCINRNVPFGTHLWRKQILDRLGQRPRRPTSGRPPLFVCCER